MTRFFSLLAILTWGVWAGGLVGIFIAVTSLNRTFPTTNRESGSALLFGQAAGGVFHSFERVQLILAGVAIVVFFAWRHCRGAVRLKTAMLILILLCTGLAASETFYVAPQIEQLRVEGQTRSDQFRMMHGLSMALYSGTLALLAATGIMIPFAIGKDAKSRVD